MLPPFIIEQIRRREEEERRKHELDAVQVEIERRSKELEQRARELDDSADLIASREADLAAARGQIEQEKASLREAVARLSAETETLARERQNLANDTSHLDKRRDEIARLDQEIAARRVILLDRLVGQRFELCNVPARFRPQLALVVAQEVQRNAAHPRPKRAPRLELSQLPVRDNERILRKILCVLQLAHPHRQARADTVLVRGHQLRKRRRQIFPKHVDGRSCHAG